MNRKAKVEKKELLEDEDLMKFIIMPLSYRKKEGKEEKIRETVLLAKQIQDRDQLPFILHINETCNKLQRKTASHICSVWTDK